MPGTEWSLSLGPQFALLLCLGCPAGQKHLLVLRLLHSFPYKLLAQSAFISRNHRLQASGGKGKQRLPQVGRELRGKRTTVEFSPSLRPVSRGRSRVRLNLGNLPSAALHKIGVRDAKALGTNDDFTGERDVRVHAYLYMPTAAVQVGPAGQVSGRQIFLHAISREKRSGPQSFKGLPSWTNQGHGGGGNPIQ